MKLNEALAAVAGARDWPVRQRAFLACGFEPLHLPVFLRAHHAQRFGGQGLGVGLGVYGDLLGNLKRSIQSDATLAWVVAEWADIDPRLGLRSTGAWSGMPDQALIASASERLDALRVAIAHVAERMPVVLAAPSIPFPLLGHTSGWQASPVELELELALARFLAELARLGNVRVLHPLRSTGSNLSNARHDPRLEIAAGFPYTLEHASTLARGLVELGFPRSPKKGLITDLDDTLWSGIVGEIGVEAVSWSQAEHSQLHGIYQLLLRQLADAGVLLGIASKNQPEVVAAALARPDLLVDGDRFFPVAVSWKPKSEAVSAILRSWNIGADDVVVVDDSRMELEEIRRIHPGITCLEFAPKDARRSLELLVALRDAFGKPQPLAEDKLRAASIRSSALFEQQKTSADLGSFLAGLDGTVTFDARRESAGGRWLELINKTNQFNLNGARLTDGEWLQLMREDGVVALGVAYRDRYGSLGTIGVVVGRATANGVGATRLLEISHWVLSCRAFSRRIEDHVLAHLFEIAGVDCVRLSYQSTPRNQPFREFLSRLEVSERPDGGALDIRRAELVRIEHDLPHRIERAAEG